MSASRAWKPLKQIQLQRWRGLQTAPSPAVSQFASVAAAASSKFQLYFSITDDPYLNLSIEHHLLQTTPADSTILFLYANRPCVVIGRNQNPWLETNLALLSLPRSLSTTAHVRLTAAAPSIVELVRRRSGGGTVFHGPGNVNYSVICPSSSFTRDKHAEMVARALQTMNPTAHVNARHDIVLHPSPHSSSQLSTHDALPSESSPPDPSATAAAAASEDPTPRKVSGSAFKLTGGRALHHGTCLLCTPHLGSLATFLKSPARGFLQARGVDSVPSSVANVLPPATDATVLRSNLQHFHKAVLRSFANLHIQASLAKPDIKAILDAIRRATAAGRQSARPEPDVDAEPEILTLHTNTVAGILGSSLATLPSIREGMSELRSMKWLFEQTPRFTLTSARTEHDQQEESLSAHFDDSATPQMPAGFHIHLAARNGVVTGAAMAVDSNSTNGAMQQIKDLEQQAASENSKPNSLGAALKDKALFEMRAQDWQAALSSVSVDGPVSLGSSNGETCQATVDRQRGIATWLSRMLALPQQANDMEPVQSGT